DRVGVLVRHRERPGRAPELTAGLAELLVKRAVQHAADLITQHVHQGAAEDADEAIEEPAVAARVHIVVLDVLAGRDRDGSDVDAGVPRSGGLGLAPERDVCDQPDERSPISRIEIQVAAAPARTRGAAVPESDNVNPDGNRPRATSSVATVDHESQVSLEAI